nr:zeta toxin family protein [Pseudomonas alcaligenes]
MATPYTLEQARHEKIYSQISADYLSHVEAQESPRAIITGGQPGSGKGALARQAENAFAASGSCVSIDVDELRDYHPQYKELQRVNDREAANLVHPDASAWASQLIRDAAAARKNIVIDQTSKSPDALIDLTKQLKAAGYNIELRVMAVNSEISEQRIHTRYEKDKADNKLARFVPPEVHFAGYIGLPESVAAVEREKAVDGLSIHDSNQVSIYEIKQIDGEWDRQPEGKAVLEKERNSMTLELHKEQVAAYAELVDMLEKRGAEPAERETIEARHLKATRKLAAESFRQLPQAEALKAHPELADAYASIASTRVTARDHGLSPEQRHVVMARTRLNIAAAIERGTTPQPDYFRTAFDSTKPPAAAVRAEVKQMFALEPDSKINAGNISAKTAANDLEAIKLPVSDAELKQTAKFVVEKLNEIRKCDTESGKAEIRRAGQAVAALTAASPALATEITAAADIESKPYIAAIVEQGHNLNTTQLTQAQQAKGPDMEM